MSSFRAVHGWSVALQKKLPRPLFYNCSSYSWTFEWNTVITVIQEKYDFLNYSLRWRCSTGHSNPLSPHGSLFRHASHVLKLVLKTSDSVQE